MPSGCCPPPPSAPVRPFGVEVVPPKGRHLPADSVAAVRSLLKLGPDFVTVTYGAGGSAQDGTREFVSWIAQTGVPVYAHLTCQAASPAELDGTIDELLAAGVTGVLALRGDERDDGTRLVLPHADALVRRVHERARAAGLPVRVAVAAFPTGHPDSRSLDEDAQTLRRKQDAGADFAVTQTLLSSDQYWRFLDLTSAAGVSIPVVPGLMAPTGVKRLDRLAGLAGTTPPENLRTRLSLADDPAERLRIAGEWTISLATELLDGGAPGIQLFTLNDPAIADRVAQVVRARRSTHVSTQEQENNAWQRILHRPVWKAGSSSGIPGSAAIAS